jgi:hypothetical protein
MERNPETNKSQRKLFFFWGFNVSSADISRKSRKKEIIPRKISTRKQTVKGISGTKCEPAQLE